jgi:hypothetical protein
MPAGKDFSVVMVGWYSFLSGLVLLTFKGIKIDFRVKVNFIG